MRIRINGARRITERADDFERKIQSAVRKAMIETAMIDIETGAKRKLTRDGHIDTGRLRASIHTAYKISNGSFQIDNTNHNYSDNQGNNYTSTLDVESRFFQVVVGTDVFYADFVEMLDSFLFYALNKAKPKLKRRIKKETQKILRG